MGQRVSKTPLLFLTLPVKFVRHSVLPSTVSLCMANKPLKSLSALVSSSWMNDSEEKVC